MSALLFGMALAVGAPALKEKTTELDVVGEWVVSDYLVGGQPAPPGVEIRFAADGTSVFSGGPPMTTHRATYTVDRKQSPVAIDIVFPDLPGSTMVGIVKADGDNLVVCFNSGGERPKEFTSPPKSATGLLTLKRLPKKD
jgi:uncharacterized protein (TIGR03067 family)